MIKHVDLIVKGRVQGVFFRQSAKREADELGVTGFVKNMPDGSVRVEAEGEADNISKFIDWCWEGPLSAEVKSVEVDADSEVKNYKDFKIVHD